MFDNDQIREMTKRGYTVAHIAKALGVNRVKLLKHCVDEDLPHIRQRGAYDRFIFENYGVLSFYEMGRVHGVSRDVMRKRAIVLGIHDAVPPSQREYQSAFMRHLTIAQAEEIAELRELDLPIREVCRKMPSVKNWVVDKFIKYYDHQTPTSRRRAEIKANTHDFLTEHGDDLIKMGKQGYTTLEMAEKTGGDLRVIWNFLYKGGHKFKRSTGKHRNNKAPKRRSTHKRPAPRPQMSDPWKLALGIRA